LEKKRRQREEGAERTEEVEFEGERKEGRGRRYGGERGRHTESQG
jgi:hypothetical protein